MSDEPKSISIPAVVRPRQYIADLQSRKVTMPQIAEAIGLSVRMICHMKKFDHEPRWSQALKLLDLHAEHCSTATAQPSTFTGQ